MIKAMKGGWYHQLIHYADLIAAFFLAAVWVVMILGLER